MALPAFVQLRSESSSAVYHVDIPRDLDELVAWMYVLAKGSSFPVEMDVLGGRQCFESLEQMLGFVMGVKRTSDLFKVAAPLAQ